MSGGEAASKAAQFQHLVEVLDRRSIGKSTARGPLYMFWVPGRIEVLGKHTDYGGGRSLLCAVERGICVVARASRTEEPRIYIQDANSGEFADFAFSADTASRPGHWSNYAITVAQRIASNFTAALRGTDVIFASDLPPAAGVSSSSALVVAVFQALSAVNDLAATPEYQRDIVTCEDLAGYLGCVENGLNFKGLHGHRGVGTFGGSEDHAAILCSRTDALSQFSFCPVTFERSVALPPDHCFIIGSSGVLAEKTGSALEEYNQVSRRLTAAFEIWTNASGRAEAAMGAAVQASSGAPERIRNAISSTVHAHFSSESLLRRFDQFVLESEHLIPSATDALQRCDLGTFGYIVARSQAAAEQALDNQVPQTIELVASALVLGAAAASAFGAGFGGSVWALVRTEKSESFIRDWSAAYAAAFPGDAARASFFRTGAGPAAMRL